MVGHIHSFFWGGATLARALLPGIGPFSIHIGTQLEPPLCRTDDINERTTKCARRAVGTGGAMGKRDYGGTEIEHDLSDIMP